MKKIKKIKSGFLSRQLAMGKMAFGAGKNFLLNKDKNIVENLVHNQLDRIVNELGLMKGSITKAGQMLSLFGEAFLPAEAREVLKKLENQTYFLEWKEIKKNIPKSFFESLEIEETPVAAASLGQVHKAKNKKNNELYALKLQYKGVDKAIDNDLKALKLIFNLLKVIPREINHDDLFKEIKRMLLQEVDYKKEARATRRYNKLAGDLDWLHTPLLVEDFSTSSILCTEWIEGRSVRDEKVLSLSQERRNHLAEKFFDLFFRELYQWKFMQSDAHFGNYLIQLENDLDGKIKNDRWVSLDFGAFKELDNHFAKMYGDMIKAIIRRDRKEYLEIIESFGVELNDDVDMDFVWEYCEIVATPFNGEVYDWGQSDIPNELMKRIPKMMQQFSGDLPFEGFFIDRKIAGVFFMMKHLGAQINAREIFEEKVGNIPL